MLMVYFVAGMGRRWCLMSCWWCTLLLVWGGGGGCVCHVDGVLCCWCGEEVVFDVMLMVYFVAGMGEEVVFDVMLMVYFVAGLGLWGGGGCICHVDCALCWRGGGGGGGRGECMMSGWRCTLLLWGGGRCVWCQVDDDVLCYRGGVCTARPSGRRWECMRTVTLCEYRLTFLWKSFLTTVWPFWKIGCCIQFVSCLELGGSAKAWWDLLCAAVFQHNYTF